MIKLDKFKIGRHINLPFNETGIIKSHVGNKCWVKITVSNGFNVVDDVVDFLDEEIDKLNKIY